MSNNNNAYPFIFGRLTEESQKEVVYGGNIAIKDWAVMIAQPDFNAYHCEWMNDKELGDVCVAPDVDICVEDDKVFPTFEEATFYVATWWANRLFRTQNGYANLLEGSVGYHVPSQKKFTLDLNHHITTEYLSVKFDGAVEQTAIKFSEVKWDKLIIS